MARKKLFDQVATAADGRHGHLHIRIMLAEFLNLWMPALSVKDTLPLIESLRSPQEKWPDDLADEDKAIEMLQDSCEDGLHLEMHEGDLLVVEDDEHDDSNDAVNDHGVDMTQNTEASRAKLEEDDYAWADIKNYRP